MKRLNRKQFQTPHVNELILYYKQLLAVLNQPNLTTLMKVHVQKMVRLVATLALLSVIELKEEELLSMLQLLFNNGASTILITDCLNFLRAQLNQFSQFPKAVENLIEEQLTHQFIKKYLLNMRRLKVVTFSLRHS